MTDLAEVYPPRRDLRPLASPVPPVDFDLDNPIAAIDLERHVVEKRPAGERF